MNWLSAMVNTDRRGRKRENDCVHGLLCEFRLLKESEGRRYARAAFSTKRLRMGVRGEVTLSTMGEPGMGIISAKLV